MLVWHTAGSHALSTRGMTSASSITSCQCSLRVWYHVTGRGILIWTFLDTCFAQHGTVKKYSLHRATATTTTPTVDLVTFITSTGNHTRHSELAAAMRYNPLFLSYVDFIFSFLSLTCLVLRPSLRRWSTLTPLHRPYRRPRHSPPNLRYPLPPESMAIGKSAR